MLLHYILRYFSSLSWYTYPSNLKPCQKRLDSVKANGILICWYWWSRAEELSVIVKHPERTAAAAEALACEAVSLFSSSKQGWWGFLPPFEGPACLFMSQSRAVCAWEAVCVWVCVCVCVCVLQYFSTHTVLAEASSCCRVFTVVSSAWVV